MGADIVNREDLLILLEDGPHGATHLAAWLRQRQARVLAALRQMAREGLVRRVGVEKRWGLTTAPAAAAPAPSAHESPFAPSRPAVDVSVDTGFDDDLETETDEDALVAEEMLGAVRRGPGRPKALRQVESTGSARGPAWWVEAQRKPREEFAAEAKHQFETHMLGKGAPRKLFPGQIG